MAIEYPETTQDFIDQFSTDKACRQYVAKVRWNGVPRCPHCTETDMWAVRRDVLQCKKCRRDISVTAGTVFGDSRIPLRLWFQALWCLVSQKHGVSALGLARALGIKRYETAWYLLQRMRGVMVRQGRERLSGIVEVDEVFLGAELSQENGVVVRWGRYEYWSLSKTRGKQVLVVFASRSSLMLRRYHCDKR